MRTRVEEGGGRRRAGSGSSRRRSRRLLAGVGLLVLVLTLGWVVRGNADAHQRGHHRFSSAPASRFATPSAPASRFATPSAPASRFATPSAPASRLATPSAPASRLATPSAAPSWPSEITPSLPPATFQSDTPPRPSWPGPGSTGPQESLRVKTFSEPVTVTTSGAVYDGYEFAGGLDIAADNVTIRNAVIRGSGWWVVRQRAGVRGLTVVDSEIDGRAVQYGVRNDGGAMTLRRLNIHAAGNAVAATEGVLEDSYLHDPKSFPGDHIDMIENTGGTGPLVIRHNVIINPDGQTSAVGLFADFGSVRNVLVQDNWLAGGGYTIYGGTDTARGVRVVGNVFSRQVFPQGGVFGPVAYWSSESGSEWTGNVWEDTGEPVMP